MSKLARARLRRASLAALTGHERVGGVQAGILALGANAAVAALGSLRR